MLISPQNIEVAIIKINNELKLASSMLTTLSKCIKLLLNPQIQLIIIVIKQPIKAPKSANFSKLATVNC